MPYYSEPTYTPVMSSNRVLAKAYGLLAILLGATYFGTTYGMAHSSLVTGHYLLTIVLFFGLGIASQFAARVSLPLGYVMALAFSLVAGAYIAPEILAFLRFPGGLSVLQDTLATTTTAVLGISIYALTTKRDFSHLRGFLWVGLIVLLVGLVANIFLHLSALQMALAGMGALLFSALLMVDTNRLRDTVDPAQSLALVLSVYLDIFNLFQFVLELFAGTSRN